MSSYRTAKAVTSSYDSGLNHMLQLTGYKKKYHAQTVLDIANLQLNKGIYWLKGANGIGKSTLLKSIAGILDFEGSILLNETINLKKNPLTFRKKVNFAEAEPVFPGFLTGMDMIQMFASAKSAEKGQENIMIEEMAMSPYIHEAVGTYSSGMLKKLSLLLAFLGDPEWILLDEPLITIDTAALKVLYQWINNRNIQKNTGFILASHQDLSDSGLTLEGTLYIANKQIVKS